MMSTMYSATQQFRFELGAFFQVWLAVEFTVDLAIGKFLGVPDEETHLMTAGLSFGRRATLLRSLVARSDHKDKGKITKLLQEIQDNSLRNIFSHAYLLADARSVTFLERIPHGKFTAKSYPFSGPAFTAHVERFIQAAKDFETTLGVSTADVDAFGAAALSFVSKSND
jgi:hypothetical protein